MCSPSAAPLRKMKLGTTAQQQYHQKASSLSACPPKGPRVPCQINQQDTNAFDPLLESKMSNLLKEQDQGKGSSNLSMIIIFTSTVLVFGFFFLTVSAFYYLYFNTIFYLFLFFTTITLQHIGSQLCRLS